MSQPEAERARAFLDRADADLVAVRALEKLDTVPDEIVGFHGQQAAEKLLKAVLAARGIDFPRTHSIRFLLDQPTTNVRARKAWIAKRLRPIGLHEATHLRLADDRRRRQCEGSVHLPRSFVGDDHI